MAELRGYLSSAVGSPIWLEVAIDCALALRAHDPAIPRALLADAEITRRARGLPGDIFQFVIPLAGSDPKLAKLRSRDYTPFERTLYVDADALALDSLLHCFEPLEHHPVVMIAEWEGRNSRAIHHGRSVRSLCAQLHITRYYKSNSGFFGFRREGTGRIFEELAKSHRETSPTLYPRWLRKFLRIPDEYAFAAVGSREEFGIFPHPPMMWSNELARLDLDAPAGKLLHHIASIPPSTLDKLMEILAERRAVWGLPRASEHWWRRRNQRLQLRRRLQISQWLRALEFLDRLGVHLWKR